jgi:hypothetical protein
MKITVKKVKKILHKDFGWENLDTAPTAIMSDELIKDTLKIVKYLIEQHGRK